MRIKFFALAGVLLLSPLYAAFAGSIDQLVVFGDSLSDNGNAAAALASRSEMLGNGNYAPNAYTDGRNTVRATTGPFGLWVDQFSAKFGLADPQPFLVDTKTSLAINPAGANFAFGDALTGHDPGFNTGNPLSNTLIPWTADQVGIYLNHNTASPNTLYSFWAGANDLFNALQNDSGNILGDSVAAADNIESNIKTLAADGAKNFLWFNLPALGDTPDAQAAGFKAVFAANLATQVFNSEVQSDTASLKNTLGINIKDVDTYTLLKDMVGSPGNYNFTNVTTPAQGLQNVNPNEYLFWDGVHPTTAADSYLAQLVDADVSSQFTAVPEPGTLVFAMFGLLVVFAGLRLRRGAC